MKKCLLDSCKNLTNNKKYCSRKCSATDTNRKYPKRIRKSVCRREGCQTITKSFRHTVCEVHWEKIQEHKFSTSRERTLEEFWERKSAKGKHPSWKNAQIRTMARNDFSYLIKRPCACCGYDLHVELCHIKALSDFPKTAKIKEVNSEDNLVQLCRNCHWEFDHLDRLISPKEYLLNLRKTA